MDNDILSGLNDAQKDAVTSPATVLQVLAPPGSGKTKTLTARVAYLINHRHIKPWNITVCTFTNKASNEMKDRVRGMVGEEIAKQLQLGTFHSTSLRYLRRYGHYIGLEKDFGIADASDSKAIVNRIIKQQRLTIDVYQARARISSLKAKGIDSEEVLRTAKKADQQEFAVVYTEYESNLRISKLLDYDDILLRCRTLLSRYPQCVSNVEALLIDEFQDTNNIQYELMGLMAQQHNHITIVGDPDQSIYGWRSAEIKNLGRMKQRWTDTHTINLQENYRSSGAILHAAQHIIEQDQSRPPKKLQATHSLGLRPVLRKLPSTSAEARWLVSEIQRVRALTGGLLEFSDIAVLLRSAYLSLQIEKALGEAGVPYRMIGGMKFYDRAEIKLLLDYLRVVDQPDNSEAVARILNVPARRIGNVTIEALQKEAAAKNVPLWTLVLELAQGRCRTSLKLPELARKGLEAFVSVILVVRNRMVNSSGETVVLLDIVTALIKKLGLQEYLKKKYPEDYEARWTNVEELIAQATEASTPEWLQSIIEEEALPVVDGVDQRSSSSAEDVLSTFLAKIALTASGEEKAEQAGEKLQQITVSTIHSAKGLEWPVVFVPGCYDGSIPSSKAEDTDEERRLLYVAMTRAQALLYLSCPVKNNQRQETLMSTFLVQPGVSNFFEEHGPSLSAQLVAGFASTLGREAPAPASIAEMQTTLERDEDNYWPLTGEEPLEESARWDHGKNQDSLCAPGTTRPVACFTSAKVTMQQQDAFSMPSTTVQSGFVSVAARMEELREEAQLRRIDRRAAEGAKSEADGPKGRKRQIEGQGSIASFFSKPKPPTLQKHASSSESSDAKSSHSSQRQKMPLQELRNTQAPKTAMPDEPVRKPLLSQHRPSTQPTRVRPIVSSASLQRPPDPGYLFLSSSPPQPEGHEHAQAETGPENEARSAESFQKYQSRPATTFHTTSMQSLGPSRRTLGVKRSLNGWSTRGGKS